MGSSPHRIYDMLVLYKSIVPIQQDRDEPHSSLSHRFLHGICSPQQGINESDCFNSLTLISDACRLLFGSTHASSGGLFKSCRSPFCSDPSLDLRVITTYVLRTYHTFLNTCYVLMYIYSSYTEFLTCVQQATDMIVFVAVPYIFSHPQQAAQLMESKI